ncbi:Diaminopimelate decarboxylase [Serratia liquefaciens]|nr:Diaminopimelate decarboxylase [Serratia liquefaciens]
MPHSLYATDTDLTADNLLRLPRNLAARSGSMMRRLFAAR